MISRVYTGFFVGGGKSGACLHANFFVFTFQGYNNYSFQRALSALSRQGTPSYPYILKWKLVKTPRKVTQYHKAI